MAHEDTDRIRFRNEVSLVWKRRLVLYLQRSESGEEREGRDSLWTEITGEGSAIHEHIT
jgi:hypothetical protein